MYLNTVSPGKRLKSKAKRLGRGIGSGLGKTCGKGHKGQKSRSGGKVRPGFEGGQMPLQRRLPKFGFNSRLSRITAEIPLSALMKLDDSVTQVDFKTLQKFGLVQKNKKRAKIMLSGNISRPFQIQGIKVTKGAIKAIEAAGGSVSN